MVTVVLLNVALIWTTARLTLRRVFRFLAFATVHSLPVGRIDPHSFYALAGTSMQNSGPATSPGGI
jgi:hypothetical protein